MGASVASENVTDWFTQKVVSLTKDKQLFERKAPNYNAFKAAVQTEPITQKGYRLPHWKRMPGGTGGYLPSDPSFQDYVPPTSRSMYVFPTYMAHPIIMDGAAIRMLQKPSESSIQSLNDVIDLHYTEFTKHIEWIVLGDGSGLIAVSAATITTLGTGGTLTCSTTAATTFGQTKGGRHLEEGHYYDSINPSTLAVRGSFYVETENASAPTIFLLNGSISSGDYITFPNSYNRMPRGLAHLISNASRYLQTLNTATDPNLNSYGLDLAGALCTPSTFDQAKTALQMASNDEGAENGLMAFCTYNFYSILKRQGWNLGIQPREETVGVAKRYVDGDTTFTRSLDMDEDRCYLAQANTLPMFEEMPLQEFNIDGQTWRMLLGNNGTGSDSYQKAFGICFNAANVWPRKSAFIKRALFANTQAETTVFA